MGNLSMNDININLINFKYIWIKKKNKFLNISEKHSYQEDIRYNHKLIKISGSLN